MFPSGIFQVQVQGLAEGEAQGLATTTAPKHYNLSFIFIFKLIKELKNEENSALVSHLITDLKQGNCLKWTF